MIAGVVLAAGLSERMEQGTKQLLPFGSRSMVGHVVSIAEESSLDPIVVVTGHASEEVQSSVDAARAVFAVNPDFATGNMGSLHVGTAALDSPAAVMILLGDQPEVSVETIETVAAAWRELTPFAVMSRYRGVIGHPWVLSAQAIAGSAAMEGTKKLFRWLTEDHADDVVYVELDKAKPTDVNTSVDYQTALHNLGLAGDDG